MSQSERPVSPQPNPAEVPTEPYQGYQDPQPQYYAQPANPAQFGQPYQAYATGQPTPPPPQQQPARKGRGWIVALVIVVVLLGMLGFGMWSCSAAVASLGDTALVEGADMLSSEAVGVIEIDGTIAYDGTACSPEGLKAQLDTAAENDYIVAVVLRVNSGGGTATAGEEMATYVREFCEETGKPVVVSSAASNASAAYEISSQADYIYVAKSTAIGSIGTALQIVDYSDLLDLLGISVDNITSSSSKDSSYGTRSLTDEERAYYQDMVDQINDVFIQNVADGRGMSVDEVKKLATGLSFTGVTAVENGLADEIGTKEDAIEKAAEMAGYRNLDAVSLEPTSSADLSDLIDLMSSSKTSISAEELAKAIKELENDGSLAQ